MNPKSLIVALLAISFFLPACKKSVDLPDPKLESLFGSWEWLESSGGFSGSRITPSSAGYTRTVEFGANGVYKIYRDGKLEDKVRFTVTESSSPYYGGPEYIITYGGSGIFGPEQDTYLSESIHFRGQDTLALTEDCADCYGHVYVRNK